jgi:hypothetical protein
MAGPAASCSRAATLAACSPLELLAAGPTCTQPHSLLASGSLCTAIDMLKKMGMTCVCQEQEAEG